MRIACIGEAMVELSLEPAPSMQARVGFAGDTLNTAIYLKRAAPALEVAYVTRLGRDDLSSRMRDYMASEGLDLADVEVSETRRPGLYAISTDETGERSFSYWRDSSAARELFQQDGAAVFTMLEKYDVLYLSAITLAILPDWVRSELCDWLARWRGPDRSLVFDSNYRPSLWSSAEVARSEIARIWELCDIALPSVDDEMAIFGEADAGAVAARMRACGVCQGALKCASAGPVSLGAPVSQAYPPAARVVDTTAAGDSFNAGYLAALLTGSGQAEALMAGHMLACKVVGVKGAIAPR